MGMDETNLIIVATVGFIGLFLYFVPTIVASGRSHPSSGAIFVLNLLLGWSFFGWVIALVWALVAIPQPIDVKGNR